MNAASKLLRPQSIRFLRAPLVRSPLAQRALQRPGYTATIVLQHRRYTTENVSEKATSAANALTESTNQVAAQIGDFKAMGLCNFTPVGGLEAFLEAINVYTGLPWWGTIVSATVLIRLALMPVVVKIQRNNAALRNISPEVGRLTVSLKQAQASGDSVAVAQLSNDLRRLFQKNNCHPLKSLGMPLLQMPVMVSFFLALRAMSELPVPGLQDGGLAWFTDLTAKDPCYALPALSAGAMLAVLEAGGEVGATSTQAQSMKNVFRFITVAMIPATAWMPSSVFVYWLTSNIFSIGQVLMLKSPSIRRALKIPAIDPNVAKQQGPAKSFRENWKEQWAHQEKLEKERVLRERQRAAALARRQSKRRF